MKMAILLGSLVFCFIQVGAQTNDHDELKWLIKNRLTSGRKDLDEAIKKGGKASLPIVRELLAEFLAKDDFRVRAALGAVQRVVALSPEDQEVRQQSFALFYEMLSSKNPEARLTAIQMIGKSGSSADASRLLPLLEDSTPDVRIFATSALVEITSPEMISQLQEIAARRKNGLTPEQIRGDFTIKYLEDAIQKIKEKQHKK